MFAIRPLAIMAVCLALGAAAASAARLESVRLDARSAPAAADKSVTETLILLGGPLGDGDFEAGGLPDRDGWLPKSVAQALDDAWHADTYHAADLDPDQPDNHAYWCGKMFPACSGGGMSGGYGNSWNVALSWSGAVADAAQPVTVTLEAVLTHDTEPGYDFLYLEVSRQSGWEVLESWDGQSWSGPLNVVQTFTVAPEDLGGPDGDEVLLHWVFVSDGAWSNEDCLFPTDGAARLDNLTVSFDQGGGPEQVSFDDVEPGTPRAWQGSNLDCTDADVWADLHELGTCWDWDSPVLAFLNDGGCGETTHASIYDYGPDGLAVACPGQFFSFQTDAMLSPAVELPADWQQWDGMTLSFDSYVHQGQVAAPLVFWQVRTSNDGGQTWGWYKNHGVLYEWREIRAHRFEFDLTAITIGTGQDATHIQVLLGLGWIGYLGSPDCDLLTPAPWYDNVELALVNRDAPDLRFNYSGTYGRALSTFPAAGAIDPADPAAAAVPWTSERDDPAGAVTVQVAPSRADAVITGAELHWRLRPNPVFDPYRAAPPPNPVPGVFTGENDNLSRRVWYEYSFELPDLGFLFPGDVLQWYVVGEELRDGATHRATFPPDTSSVGVFYGDQAFALPGHDPTFVVQALPTVLDLPTVATPPVLVWLAADPQLRDAWRTSLSELGWREGEDYDLLYQNWLPDPCPELARYELLIVDAGEIALLPPQDDILWQWHELGDRQLLAFGADMVESHPWLSLASTWFGATVDFRYGLSDVRPLVDDQAAPVVAPTPGNVLGLTTSFVVDSRCHWIDFDALDPVAAGERFYEYLAPGGQPGAYTYAAGVLRNHDNGSRGVALPFPLTAIAPVEGDPGGPASARTRVLAELLTALGAHDGSVTAAGDLPGAVLREVQAVPNPFNPRTELRFTLGRDAVVDVKLYDLRGRRVATLSAGDLAAGPHALTWNGTDDQGRALATGVYLAVVRAGEASESLKLTLVR